MQVIKLKFMREAIPEDIKKSFGVAFSRLLPEEETFLLKSADTHTYESGETILIEDSRPEHIFVIEQGAARVLRRRADGKEMEVLYLGRGDVFGEMSFVDNTPASATVVAETLVRTLCIPVEMIHALMKGDLEFSGRFYHSLAATLAERLRETTHRHIDFRPRSGKDRRQATGAGPHGVERRSGDDRRSRTVAGKKDLPLL